HFAEKVSLLIRNGGSALGEIPSTGYAGFDEDLEAIFKLDRKNAEDAIKAASGNISEIAKKLDRNFIRAPLGLEVPKLFETFARDHPRQLVPVLTEAREIARGVLGDLLTDPVKRQELDDQQK